MVEKRKMIETDRHSPPHQSELSWLRLQDCSGEGNLFAWIQLLHVPTAKGNGRDVLELSPICSPGSHRGAEHNTNRSCSVFLLRSCPGLISIAPVHCKCCFTATSRTSVLVWSLQHWQNRGKTEPCMNGYAQWAGGQGLCPVCSGARWLHECTTPKDMS